MSVTFRFTRAAFLARLQAVMAGTVKRFPAGAFTLDSAAYTTATLLQLFQSVVDALVALDAAEANAADALTAVRQLAAKVGPVLLAYERYLRTTFGPAAQALADFGLTPRRTPAPRTIAQNAAAAAKAKATRAARGTKGSKQAAALRGNVTGVVITPVTQGPAPAQATPPAPPPAQPAPASPPANGSAATPRTP